MNIYEKILVGKVFKFYYKHHGEYVILGVKKEHSNYQPMRLQILVAEISNRYTYCNVLSWLVYSKNLYWVGRRPKKDIVKCLKTNPDKVKYHIGKTVNIKRLTIYDSRLKYYKEYLESLNQ